MNNSERDKAFVETMVRLGMFDKHTAERIVETHGTSTFRNTDYRDWCESWQASREAALNDAREEFNRITHESNWDSTIACCALLNVAAKSGDTETKS